MILLLILLAIGVWLYHKDLQAHNKRVAQKCQRETVKQLGAVTPEEALSLTPSQVQDLKNEIVRINETIAKKIDGNGRYADIEFNKNRNYHFLVQLSRVYEALGWKVKLTKEPGGWDGWNWTLRIKLPWGMDVPALTIKQPTPPPPEEVKPATLPEPAVVVRAEPVAPDVHDLSEVGIDSLEQKFEELEKSVTAKKEPEPRILPPLLPGGPERYLDEPKDVPAGMVVRYVPNVDILEQGWYQLEPAPQRQQKKPPRAKRKQ